MNDPVVVRIDGHAVETPAGRPLLAVLDDAGRGVTHVCYHDALGPIQTCDTCLVEVGGELRRACTLTARAGLVVTTDTPRARAARTEAMQRLLGNHQLYCTVCDRNNGACEVHDATKALGIDHQKYPYTEKPYPLDRSNPFYQYDPDQCILCGRCVEACQNVQVTETLSIDWEAEYPRVLWDGGVPAGESSCVSCGHCVTVCPCNALMEKTMVGHAGHLTGLKPEFREPAINLVKSVEPYIGYRPIFALSEIDAAMREQSIRRTKTVCTYCGVGCAFEVWTKGRQILKIQPRSEAPANGISTCVKGKFGWDYVNSERRLTTPLIREDGRFREASWDEALGHVAGRLEGIKAEHGPDALAFIGSSKCTNEEAYLIQKLARAVAGTNNVDNCSRYCQAPATQGLWRTVGYGGDSGSITDIARAEVVFIVGSNTAESHPVLATRIKRAQKHNGQKVIVADLRRHEMAARADLFLRPSPGTDLVWLSAVSRYILDNGLEATDFLDEWVHGLDGYRASLEPFTLDFAERVTGIPQRQIVEAAEMIARAETVCGLWAMGVTQHVMGSDTSTAIANLLLLTGNFGRPGTGGYPLRGHNNVQGTSDFGAINTFFPGYQKVADEGVRKKFEDAWGVALSGVEGLNNHEMIEAIHDGRLHALYVMGEEISLVDANINYVQEALETLDFLVVQDLFFSATAQFADVVLPACPSLEKEGTFVNTERRIQRLYRALDPLPGARPDWRILTDLAWRMGHDWGYTHPREIMREIATVTPLFAGVSYARLEGFASLQWPVEDDGTDTPLLYTERFHFDDGKARLYPLDFREPTDQPDDEYDLHLNNGRLLEHFHEGNMTYKSPGITETVPRAFVEVAPALAEARGLESGDWVRLVSRRGRVKVQVLVTDRVQGNELYLPMNSSEAPVNRLTSNVTDPDSDTPAYKEVAVRMEKLGARGMIPLPVHNARNGHPTPQQGVEVERKWARPDYVPLTRDRPADGTI